MGKQQDGAEAEVISEGQRANPHGRAASHCLHSSWSSEISTALTLEVPTSQRLSQASALFRRKCSQHCTTNPLQRS